MNFLKLGRLPKGGSSGFFSHYKVGNAAFTRPMMDDAENRENHEENGPKTGSIVGIALALIGIGGLAYNKMKIMKAGGAKIGENGMEKGEVKAEEKAIGKPGDSIKVSCNGQSKNFIASGCGFAENIDEKQGEKAKSFAAWVPARFKCYCVNPPNASPPYVPEEPGIPPIFTYHSPNTFATIAEQLSNYKCTNKSGIIFELDQRSVGHGDGVMIFLQILSNYRVPEAPTLDYFFFIMTETNLAYENVGIPQLSAEEEEEILDIYLVEMKAQIGIFKILRLLYKKQNPSHPQ